MEGARIAGEQPLAKRGGVGAYAGGLPAPRGREERQAERNRCCGRERRDDVADRVARLGGRARRSRGGLLGPLGVEHDVGGHGRRE